MEMVENRFKERFSFIAGHEIAWAKNSQLRWPFKQCTLSVVSFLYPIYFLISYFRLFLSLSSFLFFSPCLFFLVLSFPLSFIRFSLSFFLSFLWWCSCSLCAWCSCFECYFFTFNTFTFLPACIRMVPVCCSYVLVCDSYVTCMTAEKNRLHWWTHTKKHRNKSKVSLLYLFYRKISKNNDI